MHQTEIIKFLQEKHKQFIEEGYPYENGFVLIMASYCGNSECREYRPCLDCLKMSNVGILENGKVTAVCGYDYIQDVELN